MEHLSITAAISAAAAISGIVLGWLGHARTARNDAEKEGLEDGELRAQVNYIARGVDDLRVEIRAANQRYDTLAERLTRTEESVKSAHKRLDRLEGRE